MPPDLVKCYCKCKHITNPKRHLHANFIRNSISNANAFSYPFAMNLITLIEIILFFSPSPTISQISYFIPSNTAFKRKHVQRFLLSFNESIFHVMFSIAWRVICRHRSKLKYSGFPFHKNLDEFDFTFQPSIDVKKIKELKTLRFIYEKENVIFLGPPGVGKTHLAVGLGMEAIREGKKAYFINAITLIDKLKRAFYERSFEKQIKFYKSLDLLIIDELGYLPLDSEGAKLFFELISEKYEQGSVIVTSNRSFNEWNKIFEIERKAKKRYDKVRDVKNNR